MEIAGKLVPVKNIIFINEIFKETYGPEKDKYYFNILLPHQWMVYSRYHKDREMVERERERFFKLIQGKDSQDMDPELKYLKLKSRLEATKCMK